MKYTKSITSFLVIFFMIIFCFAISQSNNNINASKYIQKVSVYLTFDDGPSDVVTDRILNILKEKNIKATFFIVGSQIKGREDILKRIAEGGHSLGLHTYTHKYNKIYRNEDCFIEEMNKTAMVIKEVTGIKPNILRFPGGSKQHLNSEFVEKIHSNNYRIFDWNITVSDGLEANRSSNLFFKEATKVKDSLSRIIILLHCGYENNRTCQALPRIIDFYNKPDYEFKSITDETKEYIFRYKK